MINKNINEAKKFIKELFIFRANNNEFLMDKENLNKIYKILPCLRLEEKDFSSFKYYILKNLSLIGESIIFQPDIYGFKHFFYPSIRFEQISGWNRFYKLSYYSGDLYSFISKFHNFCKKVISVKNFKGFYSLIKKFNSLMLNLNIKERKEVVFNWDKFFNIFYFHDVYSIDYSKMIPKNLMLREDFFRICYMDKDTFNSIMGFYKTFFIILQNYISENLSNNEVNSILEFIIKKENINNIKRRKNPLFWPWELINSFRNKLRELYVFRRFME